MVESPKLSSGVIMSTAAAKHGMAAALAEGKKNGQNFTIVVADAGGYPMCIERMEGVFA